MTFAYIVGYVNTLAFLIIPFRQYKGRYFYYFLVLALGNPLLIFNSMAIHLDSLEIVCILSLLSVISLIQPATLKKSYKLIAAGAILVIGLLYFSDEQESQFISIILHIIILLIFFKEMLLFYKDTLKFRTGHSVLILYEVLLILNFFTFLNNPNTGIYFHYISAAFEVFLALFFIIYKVEESPVISPLFREK